MSTENEYFSLAEAMELGLEVSEDGLLFGLLTKSFGVWGFCKNSKQYYLSPDDTIIAMDLGMGLQARSEHEYYEV